MDKVSEKGIETNKSFWNFIKFFSENKDMITSNDITIIDGKNVITDEYEFRRHLTNTILTMSKKFAETKQIK